MMNGQQHFWRESPNCEGFALPSTVMVLAIVFVLSMALTILSHTTWELVTRELASDKAKDLARAGLETALYEVLHGYVRDNPHEDLAGGFFSYTIVQENLSSVRLAVYAYSDDDATATIQALADTQTGQLSQVTENP